VSTIIQTQTTSFKAELLQGIHDLLTDTLRIALYTANANLNDATVAYTTAAEVVGSGYTAGGQILTVAGGAINTYGYTAYVNFNNVLWSPASFTARCALIYNASKINPSTGTCNKHIPNHHAAKHGDYGVNTLICLRGSHELGKSSIN
jgi:hypothetical protein